MNIDEIRLISPPIKFELERYRKRLRQGLPPRDIAGGCLWTSRDMALAVQQIIHQLLPAYSDTQVTIQVGNYYGGDTPVFPEPICEQRSKSLPPHDDQISAPYHAWLRFGDVIIDLTLLYSLLEGENDDRYVEQPIYLSDAGVICPYELHLHYVPHADYKPDRRNHIIKSLDAYRTYISAEVGGTVEKQPNFFRRTKDTCKAWMCALLNLIAGKR